MFQKIDGKLFWIGHDGKPIGPLDPATPTCGDWKPGQQ